MTYPRRSVRPRAGSERCVKNLVNRGAGPRSKRDVQFRNWWRSRHYAELPCSGSEAYSLTVFGKKSKIKGGEHQFIEPAAAGEVEYR